jgi:1,4-dihydroxy-6-naphthoate synthase
LRLVRDLGAHWEEKTGSPIPLGALVRREPPALPSVGEIESAVRASLDWAWAHEGEAMELCARHAQDMTPEVMRAHVALYVNDFSRDMGEAGRAAVRTLMERARIRV